MNAGHSDTVMPTADPALTVETDHPLGRARWQIPRFSDTPLALSGAVVPFRRPYFGEKGPVA